MANAVEFGSAGSTISRFSSPWDDYTKMEIIPLTALQSIRESRHTKLILNGGRRWLVTDWLNEEGDGSAEEGFGIMKSEKKY